MAIILNIANSETGLSVRQKLNILTDLYNQTVVSDVSYSFQRIDGSKVKSASPSGLFLRDDGTYASTSQNFSDTLLIGRKTGEWSIESDNGFSYLYALNAQAGHEFDNGAIAGRVITNATRNDIVHDLENRFNSPSNIFTNATANKNAVFNSLKELVAGSYSESDLIGFSTTAQVNAEAYADGLFATIMGGVPALAYDTIKELSDEAISIVTALGNRLRVDTNAQGLSLLEKINAKTNIDLDLVENTADIDKVISTLTQAALDTKVNGALGVTSDRIAVTTGVNNEIQGYSSFTWNETDKILKTGSQASIGSYIGVQLLADNSCTIPFSISSLGNGDGYVNFSVSANPTGASADSFLFHGDNETYLMSYGTSYVIADNGTDNNTLIVGTTLTTLNKSLLIRDIGSIGHVDEAHAKFHAFDKAIGVYFKASTGTTNWNLGDSFGFDFGVNSTGDGEIRQRENKGIDFYTNNVKRWNTNNTGNTYFGGGTIATALLQIAPNTTTRASFNIGVGVTPVSGMVDGDINNYGGRLHHRVGGVTQDIAYLSDITGGGLSELEVRRTSSLMTT